VEKLEDRLATLEHDMKSATLDYLDLYAKAKKLYGRVAKAQEREEAREVEVETGDTNGAPVHTSLSERARKIQQQILDRRRMSGGRDNGLLPG
jgi:hypothetical protein